MNYTDTDVTHETDFLSSADVLAIKRGVPRIRWNAALNQQIWRIGLLGRLSYYGPWIDYYYTRLWVDDRAPIQDDAYIVDLEASIPLAADVTLSVGGQNVFDVLADAPQPLIDVLGSRYSPGHALGPQRRVLLCSVELQLGSVGGASLWQRLCRAVRPLDQKGVSQSRGPAWRGSCAPARPRVRRTVPS